MSDFQDTLETLYTSGVPFPAASAIGSMVTSLDASARQITPPRRFKWPFNTYPVSVYGSYGRFSTGVDPRSLVNPAIWSTTNFIQVDPVNGSDTTSAVVSTPYDLTKPALSLSHALVLGNATNAPYRILAKAGTYVRAQSFHVAGVYPTQPCSVEVWGGRAVVGNFDNLTWTHDGTQTNCYTAPRSNVIRVFDILNKDSNGYYTELTPVADAATCNSTPDSWALVSNTTLYVNRTDQAVVTNSNTRAYLGANLDTLTNNQTGSDMYISGLDLEGGVTGSLYVFGLSGHYAKNIVAEDCTFRYAGSYGTYVPCARMENIDGICAFFRCDASYGTQDGFNCHHGSGNARTHVLTVNCTGINNGRGTSTSNNGLTAHENTYVIDVNGTYTNCYGGNVHCINSTQTWCVGTSSIQSYGDIPLGGTYVSGSYRVDQTLFPYAKMWLDSCFSQGSLLAVDCPDSNGSIFYRNSYFSGGALNAVGTIKSY